jgi:UDP-N-acetylglucosamine--N-acetylmuramyl-(pentapeptide) pyrophosphoryl-undecaprenol N-acetylglucosamine transferase
VPQTEFTPQRLAELLHGALADPAALSGAAAAAQSVGVANAADRLADVVLEIARPG